MAASGRFAPVAATGGRDVPEGRARRRRNLPGSPTVAPDNPSGSIRKGLPMSTRFQIAALVFMMTNAVAFGIGIVPILMIPAFANHAFEAIPAVVLASFVISAPLSWIIAPRLRARYWRPQPPT